MKLRSLVVIAAATILVTVSSVQAQTAAQGPPSCGAAEYRQFDFWVGTWEVENPQGQLVGTNSITRAFGGCVLVERWQSMTSAHAGSSHNIYDRVTGKWHQTWVDNSGLLLQLDGELKAGRMVLEGTRPRQDGSMVRHRITWEPLPDGRVRQLWETSLDVGQSWNVAFDGLYVRRR
jgi:hypothetical protein